MKITILANCSRCGEQFVISGKAGDSILPANSHDRVKFMASDKLVRHRYISGFGMDDNGYFISVKSEYVSFCEPCDSEYWKNFDDAAKVLEAFWHDPIGEGGQE